MQWGGVMVWGGTSQNSPPAPFLCEVCVCHTVPLGVTRSPRCAAPWDLGQLLRPGAPLGRGAPWSTSGCGTPMGARAPLGHGAPWALEHPRSWSTHLGHARSWSSQWDLALQLRAGLSHTKPLPSERDFGLLQGCSCPPSLQRPPPEPPAPQQPPPCTGHSPGAVPAPITTKRNPCPWWKPSTAGVSGPCTTAEPQVQQPQTLVPAEMQPGSCCELRAGAVTAKFLPMESTGSAGRALQRSPGPTDANFGKTNSQSPLSRILILNTASHRAPTSSLGSLCLCLATLTV